MEETPTPGQDPEVRISGAAGQRIVVFLFDLSLTGVARNAVRLANALVARGHRVWLLVCRDTGRDAHPVDARVALHVARVPSMASRLARPAALLAATPAIRRALRHLAPDAMVSAGNHGHLAATLASRHLPLRRILRISNELDHVHNGPLARRWRRFMHRHLIERAHRLMLVSPHLARHPLLAAAVARGKAVITPNGVDAPLVRQLGSAPCAHPWMSEPTPVVVAIGRLAPHKNFAMLVRAVARASRERKLRLIIVGGGAATERQRLLRLAAALGIGDAVQLVGEVANPHPFMAGAAVFVLPSLWEGASNVLLEALACDVPIVAARSAGNAQEVLAYGRFGLIVDARDVDGMAQAILYQSAAGSCRPGTRVADFDATAALARACNAVTGPDTPPDRPSPRGLLLPERS